VNWKTSSTRPFVLSSHGPAQDVHAERRQNARDAEKRNGLSSVTTVSPGAPFCSIDKCTVSDIARGERADDIAREKLQIPS
jgi:hypothetical protein